jgi:hypothetical protein
MDKPKLEESKQYFIEKDKFTKFRGGSAKLLLISCEKCEEEMFLYQKDGSGRLLRVYLDKFKAPKKLVENLNSIKNKTEMPSLKCKNCKQNIGSPMVYKKEKRLAYRLYKGSFTTTTSKDGYFPSK